ncbi:MAG: PH domain-containing protein [Sarcina sp.]
MEKKLSVYAVKYWILTACIELGFVIAVFLGIKIIPSILGIKGLENFILEYSKIINIIFIAICLWNLFYIFIEPMFNYKQWSYKITNDEIWYREGIFWTKEVLIPIVRIQTIDLKENPLCKKYNIANIQIGTTGGSYKIPAIDKKEVEIIMEFLREKINENVRAEQGAYIDGE